MKTIHTILFGFALLLTNSLQAHDDAFKPSFVGSLVTPYLMIQRGLAGDDLAVSQAGAQRFLAAMERAPQGNGRVDGTVEDLTTPARAIANAADITVAREAFRTLSLKMESLVQHVGVSDGTNLYRVHCPMAFGGKGGDWIQADETVANPYYGSKMLRCGSVQKQISGDAHHGHDHSDHEHE